MNGSLARRNAYVGPRRLEGASHNLPLERPLEVAHAIMGFIESIENDSARNPVFHLQVGPTKTK